MFYCATFQLRSQIQPRVKALCCCAHVLLCYLSAEKPNSAPSESFVLLCTCFTVLPFQPLVKALCCCAHVLLCYLSAEKPNSAPSESFARKVSCQNCCICRHPCFFSKVRSSWHITVIHCLAQLFVIIFLQ